jgi:hypothetical protein
LIYAFADHDGSKKLNKSFEHCFWAVEAWGLADLSIGVKQKIDIIINKN